VDNECYKTGCKHVKNEPHEDKLQIWKVCQDCGRRTAIITFTQEQWDKLKEEGRILVK
jgi:hypothetical protein